MGEVFPLANHGRPWRWERVEWFWIFLEKIFCGGGDILVEENGRMEKVGDFGGKKKEGKK